MMFLLGLRLVLRTGKESLARLVLIVCAVAIGVALLLVVLADFHAFQSANSQRCWECTTGAPVVSGVVKPAANAELWNFTEDYFEGQPIKKLEVAALGPHAPVVPGIARLPGAGSYYASPALARLLKSVPRDELGVRYPGTLAGLIGPAALSGPDDLVIVIGRPGAELARLPATQRVDAISTAPQVNSSATLYQYGFGMVAVGLVFPLLTLIGAATRLAAARREERFAAFRLVGATPRQVSVVASVEAFAGAAIGAIAGVAIFQPLQPLVARVAVTGFRYFPSTVTPTVGEYIAVLVGVPIAAIAAAVWSLQRVRISPLGAARRTTPAPPSPFRILPLILGLAVFIAAPFVLAAPEKQAGGPMGAPTLGLNPRLLPVLLAGELLTMTGLYLSGSWLTMQAARLVARTAEGASGLLAARRLADSPKTAFRSVGGLVLALFVGTAIAGIVPALNSGMQLTNGGKLNDVLRVAFFSPNPGSGGSITGRGLRPQRAAQMLARVRSYTGASALPVYLSGQNASRSVNGAPVPGNGACEGTYDCGPTTGIINCHDIGGSFGFIVSCPPNVAAVQVQFGLFLVTNNLLSASLPLGASPIPAAAGGKLRSLPMEEVLVRTNNPATLEKIRTLMGAYTAAAGSSNVPETFGEVASTRAAVYSEIETIALAVVAVTLVTAACSLAVSVGGGLMERKRPFTLLRVTGAQLRVLNRVVLLETVLPLTLTAVIAAAAGLGTAASTLRTLGPRVGSIAVPGHVYFLTLGCALLASLAVLLATLPLLGRITVPDEMRFE